MKLFKNHTFRKLIAQTTVVEVAIGITLGAVFAKLVSAVATNILLPPLVYFFNVKDVRLLQLKFSIYSDKPPLMINYGSVLDNILDFALISFILYWLARAVLKIKYKGTLSIDKDIKKNCLVCCMQIPKNARKCPYCQSTHQQRS